MKLLYTFRSATVLAGLFFVAVSAIGQTGVSINTTGAAPDNEAILDVSSTTKGALLPRMNTTQRTAINPTATSDYGMVVFDTTTKSYWY